MRCSSLISMFLLLVVTVSLMAQDNVIDLRVEFNDDVKNTYYNFIYARNLGRVMVDILHIGLPQADRYKETAVGVGYNALTVGDVAIYGLVHYGIASDGKYFEPTIYASDSHGKVTGSLFLVYYIPLGDQGINQWLIDPIEAQYNIWRSVSIGFSGYFWRPEGGSWLTKIGPKVSIADKFGNSELRVSRVSESDSFEFQLRRIFVF